MTPRTVSVRGYSHICSHHQIAVRSDAGSSTSVLKCMHRVFGPIMQGSADGVSRYHRNRGLRTEHARPGETQRSHPNKNPL